MPKQYCCIRQICLFGYRFVRFEVCSFLSIDKFTESKVNFCRDIFPVAFLEWGVVAMLYCEKLLVEPG